VPSFRAIAALGRWGQSDRHPAAPHKRCVCAPTEARGGCPY
jgi:hypothetical protein